MKVLRIEARDHYCTVTFGRDGHEASKGVRLGNDIETFNADMRRMAREADRDISMITHGDINHCEDETANRLARFA